MSPYRWYERLETLIPQLQGFALHKGITWRYKLLVHDPSAPDRDLLGLSCGGHVEISRFLHLSEMVRVWLHELGHELLLPREEPHRTHVYEADKPKHEDEAEQVALYVLEGLRLPYTGTCTHPRYLKRSRRVADEILNYVRV
jgi:hypothetical protein